MSGAERISIQQQIDEVECCLVSIRSAVQAWRSAPERHRAVETGACQSKLEPLAAAVRTLEWVRDNAEALRAVAGAGEADQDAIAKADRAARARKGLSEGVL